MSTWLLVGSSAGLLLIFGVEYVLSRRERGSKQAKPPGYAGPGEAPTVVQCKALMEQYYYLNSTNTGILKSWLPSTKWAKGCCGNYETETDDGAIFLGGVAHQYGCYEYADGGRGSVISYKGPMNYGPGCCADVEWVSTPTLSTTAPLKTLRK